MCKIKSRFHWKIFYHHLCKYQRKRDILSCINYHYFKRWEVLSWHRVGKLWYIFHYMQILWDSSTSSTHWPQCLHLTPEVTKLLSSFLHFLLSCLFLFILQKVVHKSKCTIPVWKSTIAFVYSIEMAWTKSKIFRDGESTSYKSRLSYKSWHQNTYLVSRWFDHY